MREAFFRMIDTAQEVAMWVFVGLTGFAVISIYLNPAPAAVHAEIARSLMLYTVTLIVAVTGVKIGGEGIKKAIEVVGAARDAAKPAPSA